MDKVRMNKIFQKIDSIAKKGKSADSEYYSYIDSLIDKGQYEIFQQVLYYKYGIDPLEVSTIDIKEYTFDKIRHKTTSSFQQDLQSLYNKYNVYQIGQDIIQSSKIGTIESDLNNNLTCIRADNQILIINDPNISLISKYENAIIFFLA